MSIGGKPAPSVATDRTDDGVTANERLTGSLGAVLLVLFAAEGLTVVLHVRSTLPTHVFIGMMLVPPVLAKIGTTGYRFARYYLGDPRYVDRGPPMWVMRIAGPFVVLTTIAVLATGIAETVIDPGPDWAKIGHKVSFLLWFACMTVHVLGHLRATPSLASTDFRSGVAPLAAVYAAITVFGTLALGVVLGMWSLGWQLPTPHG